MEKEGARGSGGIRTRATAPTAVRLILTRSRSLFSGSYYSCYS